MSAKLQARAKAFLERPIPGGLDYVRDSVAERLIATYAKKGKLPDDPDGPELLELAAMESSQMAETQSDEEVAAYFRESTAILEAILAEG
jgi:hypothetical protein